MKKILSLMLFGLFCVVGKVNALSVTATISSTSFTNGFAASSVLQLNPRESLTYTLTGGATGTILLEKSIDGSNFVAVISSVNNSNGVRRGIEYANEMTSYYRWRASTMTGAGSFVVTLDDNDDFASEEKNNKRLPILQFWDDTLRILNKGFLFGSVAPSTATTSSGFGTAVPVYLDGTNSVIEGTVVVATNPVAGQGVAVVVAPATINQGRWFGIATSSSNVGNQINVYTSGVVLALTTGTVIPGDMLGTSAASAGYLTVTQSSNPVVGIALTNGISGGGLTKIRLR